jgi:hypothetical protein
VQKNAAECRSAVVADMDTLYAIKRFHKMFKAVARCPEDKYSDPKVLSHLDEWLSARRRRKFFMTDLKKSGLTFNRHLHNIIIKVLHQAMPSWGWDAYHDYCTASSTINNTKHRITNGYGLGMMDCVISFAQAIVYHIFLEEGEYDRSLKLRAKFWSDDSVIRVEHPDEEITQQGTMCLEEFNRIARLCGLVIHNDKPFSSKWGVFLEHYGLDNPKWHHLKIGQYLGCMFDVLKCNSIVEAKEMSAAIILDCPDGFDEWISYIISRLVEYWGYEFSKREAYLPYEMGGWAYFMKQGFNNLFHWSQEVEEDPLLERHMRLLLMPQMNAPRSHKRLRGAYAKEIISMGIDDDTPYNWKMMSKSAFAAVKLTKQESIRRTLRTLSDRQSFWRSTDRKKGISCYGALMEYWNKIDDLGWYIPPDSKLKVISEYDNPLETLYTPKGTHQELSVMRAWLYLTKHRGSQLNIVDSNYHLSNLKDTAMALLNKLSDNLFMNFSHVRDAFVRKYNQESLKEVLGLGSPAVIVTGEDSKDFYEIITEILGCRGKYVAPLYNTGYSILTNYPGRANSFMPKSLNEDDEPHIALYYSWFDMPERNIIPLDDVYRIMCLRDESTIVKKQTIKTAEDMLYESEDNPGIVTDLEQYNYILWQMAGIHAKFAFSADQERTEYIDPFSGYINVLDEIEDGDGILGIFGNEDDETEDFG